MVQRLLATKHPHASHVDAEGLSLRRTLGPWGLTALGIGAVIGGGIFVITGQAAADHAGPAIMLSFVLAALCCAFCALAYASQIGLAHCLAAAGKKADAQAALQQAGASVMELGRGGRLLEAALLSAMAAVAHGRLTDAGGILTRLLGEAPPGYPGWTIPIEPMCRPLHAQPEFGGVLAKLAERAR